MHVLATRALSLASFVLICSALPVAGQYEDHPNVGVWISDDTPSDPRNPLTLSSVNADGTVRDFRIDGVSVGVWEPTGERTFTTTFLSPVFDEDAGFLGHVTIRVQGEIAADGQTATGIYTVEFPDNPAGVFPPPGEWGPVEFASTRLNVEAPGATVGPWPVVEQTPEE